MCTLAQCFDGRNEMNNKPYSEMVFEVVGNFECIKRDSQYINELLSRKMNVKSYGMWECVCARLKIGGEADGAVAFSNEGEEQKKAEKGNKNTQLKDKLIIVCHGKSNIKAASSSLTTNVQSEWILCTVWRIVRIYFYLLFVLWRLFPFYCVMASAWSTLSTSVCLHVFILLRWMDEPCALTSPSIVRTIFSFTLWSLCFLRNSFWTTAV